MGLKYKFLNHTADMKFQAFGKTLEEAFENSALALLETISKGEKIKAVKRKKIAVKGKDYESLLYNFLEEFLFLLDAEGFIASKIENLEISDNILMDNRLISKRKSSRISSYVNSRHKNVSEIRGNLKLTATIIGDNMKRYMFNNDVKAVTYNSMFVKQEKGKWITQVVLDV